MTQFLLQCTSPALPLYPIGDPGAESQIDRNGPIREVSRRGFGATITGANISHSVSLRRLEGRSMPSPSPFFAVAETLPARADTRSPSLQAKAPQGLRCNR